MRRLLIASALTVLCAVASTSTAQAGFFLGDPIDDARLVGGMDLADDGTGGVTYIKRVGGVDHAFVSRFADGVFQAPVRIDTPYPGASSNPAIAAAVGGRLAMVFSNGGLVHGVVRSAGKGYLGPTVLADGHHPSVDMSIHGAALASFTSNGKNVRVSRLDRLSNRWTTLPQPADIVPANAAGDGSGRSKIAIAADGVGVVTWGEGGHVFARKVFGSGLSTAPQDLTPASVNGQASTLSELPDIDVEEDSSFAWVVFRQQFSGGARILARHQRGTQFDAPIVVDAGGEPATTPRIDLNPRGIGIAVSAGASSGQPMAATVDALNTFSAPGRILFGSAVPSTPTVTMSDNREGLVAAVVGSASQPYVRVRPYVAGVAQPELNLSRFQLGPVAAGMGLEAAADRGGGFIVAWIQGGKLVAGYADKEPRNFRGTTRTKCCVAARAKLTWRQSFNQWGPMRYDVYVDGTFAGSTTKTSLRLAKPLRGIGHNWSVIGTDVRGQFKVTTTRKLTVDDLLPRQKVRASRAGRRVGLVVRGSDRRRAGHRTSGISGTAVTWGDGRKSSRRGGRVRLSHRYRHSGKFTMLITTRDKAGNETVRTRKVRIR